MIEQIGQLIDGVPSPIVLIVGIAMLLLGGYWLVEGSVMIARRMGISTLVIGLTVVAFGTSSPELSFNLIAAMNGHGELSFGNVIGSNIANIALVLGLAAFVHPLFVHGRVIRSELPLLVLVTAVALVLAWLPPDVTVDDGARRGFGRVDGWILLGGFALVSWLWFRVGRRDKADPLAVEAEVEATGESLVPLPLATLIFVVGLVALVAGGKLTENGAVRIALQFGLSEALIGLTIVALATSLPEVTTTLIACARGHADLAVGNVVGSNLFNLLLVLGIPSVWANVPLPASFGWWDLGVMMGLTLLLVPITMTHERRVLRREGLLLLACYVGYLAVRIVVELRMSA